MKTNEADAKDERLLSFSMNNVEGSFFFSEYEQSQFFYLFHSFICFMEIGRTVVCNVVTIVSRARARYAIAE
ncbi:hypothetical protein ccbrp13_21490 [Ktedonobacteria bacterium brp13]|nr:hypothetical protein ccbrp13_21490 [Ktedonobacteria bacterium brp13]